METPAGIPFHLTRDWFAAWDAAYLRADQQAVDWPGLALLDERAALGPIRFRRRRGRTNVHTPRFDIFPGSTIPTELPARLLEGGMDVTTIGYLPEDSPLLVAARSWRARVEPHALAPVVDCRSDYATWLSRRSKRVRSRWPRLEAHVTGALAMHYKASERFDDLPGLLAEMFAVEASGWKGAKGTAIADSPADTLFYTRLAHRAAAAGALRIATLRQGDRLTAFEYGILAGDRLFLLKVGYHDEFELASIGHVLAALHIRDCCADPRIAWYDKLGNGMTPAAYKLRYADLCDTLYRVTLYAPTWRGQTVRLHDWARHRAKLVRDGWRARRA